MRAFDEVTAAVSGPNPGARDRGGLDIPDDSSASTRRR
jgi:hypothetical protein